MMQSRSVRVTPQDRWQSLQRHPDPGPSAEPEVPLNRLEPDLLGVELALQHRELMPERHDLDVLVAIARRQSQQRERVRDAQVRQQHEAASLRIADS